MQVFVLWVQALLEFACVQFLGQDQWLIISALCFENQAWLRETQHQRVGIVIILLLFEEGRDLLATLFIIQLVSNVINRVLILPQGYLVALLSDFHLVGLLIVLVAFYYFTQLFRDLIVENFLLHEFDEEEPICFFF